MAATGDATNSQQLWLVPQAGEQQTGLVADVVIAERSRRVRSFAVPPELAGRVVPGALLRAPLGRNQRLVDGLCVRVGAQVWDHTRPVIAEVTERIEWLAPTLIELGLWLAEYYAAPPWLAFEALAPPALRRPELRRMTYLRLRPPGTDAPPAGPVQAAAAPEDSGAERSASAGAASDVPVSGPMAARITARQRALLDLLAAGPVRLEAALEQSGVSRATLRTLVRRGLVELETRAEPLPPEPPPSQYEPGEEDEFALTPGQSRALQEIEAALAEEGRFGVFLLFGIPGSGKTEVYVRAIRAALSGGRQAIVLIPEIALATQIVARLARRFPRVAVLHSQLAARQRRRTLAAIAAGLVDVVIGTRTAVFAPCPRLGLIVVDEEQEGSLKNLATPYYHARDVAIKRAQLARIPIVLGSATPALETWQNAHTRPHFRLLRLPERVGAAELPRVRVVLHPPGERSVLAPALVSELERTLALGQQALLLHNRRGYAVHLRCRRCGLLVICSRCGAALVEHRAEGVLKCHRCGTRETPPSACLDNSCRGELERAGLAVQRLEEELHQRFPTARLLRLDTDTMRRRRDYEEALRRFEQRGADFLLGTQMVAKGLDFPAVRLAGVIDADAGLSLPDFRAGERVLQLVVQVVGRAGRRAGESLALIQTSDDHAPAIRHALRMDYESFAQEELAQRRRMGLPPATRLVRFVLSDPQAAQVRLAAERLARELAELAGRVQAELRIDPAVPCVVARRGELFRYQVLARGPDSAALAALLQAAEAEKRLWPRAHRFTIDVDPLDLF